VAEGGGLLNADQHFGHRRFSSQVLAFQRLPRSTDLAAVGSKCLVLGAGRDNSRDSIDTLAWPLPVLGFNSEQVASTLSLTRVRGCYWRVRATIMPPRTGTGVSANSDRPCLPTTVHPLDTPTAAPNRTSLRK
jgi:hypothetical protein